MEKINERIKEICLSKYSTIANAAKCTNMNVNVLRSIVGVEKRIETPQEPKYTHLIKIIDATGCNPLWLLYGHGDMMRRDIDDNLVYERVCDDTHVEYEQKEKPTPSEEDADLIDFLKKQVLELQSQCSTLVATNSILTASLAEARSK